MTKDDIEFTLIHHILLIRYYPIYPPYTLVFIQYCNACNKRTGGIAGGRFHSIRFLFVEGAKKQLPIATRCLMTYCGDGGWVMAIGNDDGGVAVVIMPSARLTSGSAK